VLVLSYLQANALLKAWQLGQSVGEASPDLGLSQVAVHLDEDGARFPSSVPLNWGVLAEIAADANVCYRVEQGDAYPIRVYSPESDRLYSLYPTLSAPTMLVSGIPMHRIKDTDPWQDTHSKIKALGSLGGRVLDTATGLGYTAILAAQSASEVVTVELDPAAQDIARQNPWSQPLFTHPLIRQLIGDCTEVIAAFPEGYFSRIIHDPPAFSLAGEMYSLAFYRQAYRVLKPNGRIFHYIGNPESKSGASLTRGAAQRLRQAGFHRVEPRPGAFGLLAFK